MSVFTWFTADALEVRRIREYQDRDGEDCRAHDDVLRVDPGQMALVLVDPDGRQFVIEGTPEGLRALVARLGRLVDAEIDEQLAEARERGEAVL